MMNTKKYITSNYRGQEVELEYTSEIADLVQAIETAASANEDGVIQAWDMVPLFPGQPELHTTTLEYRALLAAGCVPIREVN
jgi:hypothetical protein